MKNIILLLLLLSSFNGYSQTLNYKITSNNSYIGNLKVTKSTNKDILQIEVLSEIKVKIFISLDIKYMLNCTYKNNELLYSSVTTYVNGKIHSTGTAEKNGNLYTITKNGHSSKYLNNIEYSGALMYFYEPKEKSSLFSEFDLVEKPLKKIGINEYQTINPLNGHLSEYKYEKGILESTINHHTLLTFTLTKI